MRHPRILRRHCTATFHCVSRIVDRRQVIGDAEKRYFLHWMRRLEAFSGVQVLTYCLMSNHFHLLVRVPCKGRQAALTEKQLREFLPLLYSDRALAHVRQELDRACNAAVGGSPGWLNEILARYDARRYDLSSFVKDLKQRFSQWYNAHNKRSGHLWESAFGSVLVEDGEAALLTIAAYIDLNPVRAGLCADPKDYRWSAYGEAVGNGTGAGRDLRQSQIGRDLSRQGISEMLRHTAFGKNRTLTWKNVGSRYRDLLFARGERRDADPVRGTAGRPGLSHEAVDAELARGREPSLAEVLHKRVRYFSEGGVIGSGEFVEKVFEENRGQFGERRRVGAQPMGGAKWGSLRVLRRLNGRAIG